MIDYTVIATGSQGNSVLLNRSILIDFGVPYKSVEPYVDGLKLVLITHRHSDHFKPSTARILAHNKPLLRFGCGPWMVKLLVDAGVAKSQIDVLHEKIAYNYGICNVIPVPVFHDTDNYAYKIHFPEGKVFYCTDCGSLTGITARDYALYLIEHNYDENEIKVRMDEKIARGEYCYEQRSLKYHLSYQQCDNWLYQNMGRHSEYVYLHQHVDREVKDGASEDSGL